MQRAHQYASLLKSPDAVIERFHHMLHSVKPGLDLDIHFERRIQKHNLLDLVREADQRIRNYNQIYPYIQELCNGQSIDPDWHNAIEQVLSWALKKGRGEPDRLTPEIKDAWLTYIILLSCAMIDRREEIPGNKSLDRLTRSRRHKKIFRENNRTVGD